MSFRIIGFGLAVILLGTCTDRANGECLDDSQIAACDEVFNPENMEETCCAPMEGYIETHNECMRTHSTFEFTCYVSRCVTAKLRYRKTNVIDPEMVKSAFWKYNLFSPETKPLTDEITKNCLDDKYFDYVTSETYCDYNKFELCANVNALMGCQEFYSTSSCEALAENVAICKPVLQDYLDYLNGSGSC